MQGTLRVVNVTETEVGKSTQVDITLRISSKEGWIHTIKPMAEGGKLKGMLYVLLGYIFNK